MAEVTADNGKGKVKVFDSEEEVAVGLAKYTADISNKITNEKSSFTVVLSGGSLIHSLRYLTSLFWFLVFLKICSGAEKVLERKGKLNFESGVFDPTIFGFVVVVMRTYFWKLNEEKHMVET